jgi:hypothetical protein
VGFYSTVNGREIPPPGKAAGDIERLCVIRFALGFPLTAVHGDIEHDHSNDDAHDAICG